MAALLAAWRQGRQRARRRLHGGRLVAVPREDLPEVMALLYRRQFERACARWAAREHSVTLEDWKQAGG